MAEYPKRNAVFLYLSQHLKPKTLPLWVQQTERRRFKQFPLRSLEKQRQKYLELFNPVYPLFLVLTCRHFGCSSPTKKKHVAISAAFTWTSSIVIKILKQITLPFGNKMLLSSYETTNPYAQLTKNITQFMKTRKAFVNADDINRLQP